MITEIITPFDLHVLGTPPAFVLSQDQTLKKIVSKRCFHRSNHFLNNLLLAILLKNFVGCSLFALIHELLNKSINLSKVFGLSLRYSIYKVQGSSLVAVAFASAANFYILAHHFEFVKHFFKFFQILFDVSCAPGFRRSSHNFFMISHRVQFVKHFFLVF